MWNRQELKSNARIMLKANYLKIVIVSVVFALLTSSGYQSAKGAAKGSDADISLRHLTGIQWSLVMAAFVGIMGVVIIAFLVNVLIAVFVWNPLSVGCIKYFIDCRYGNAEWKDILFVFRNNYVNVCVNIFLKQLFTFLWCLLLIVPGIVKAYEYMMVPYILAENPDMSREEQKNQRSCGEYCIYRISDLASVSQYRRCLWCPSDNGGHSPGRQTDV